MVLLLSGAQALAQAPSVAAWQAAPFALYFTNTVLLVVTVIIANFALCTLVAFAFVRYRFRWAGPLFSQE